jgi:hypothetical protein
MSIYIQLLRASNSAKHLSLPQAGGIVKERGKGMKTSSRRIVWHLCMAGLALGWASCIPEYRSSYDQIDWYLLGDIPEGGSVILNNTGFLELVDWPGTLVRWKENPFADMTSDYARSFEFERFAWLDPDSLRAFFFADSIDNRFMADSLRVRMSGYGRGHPYIHFLGRGKTCSYFKVTKLEAIE